MSLFKHALLFGILFSPSLWADLKHTILNCQRLLASSHANQVAVAARFENGIRHEAKGVAYVGASQQELLQLIQDGSLKDVNVYAVTENPLIQALLKFRKPLLKSKPNAYTQFNNARIDAWYKTIPNLIAQRSKMSAQLLDLNRQYLLELVEKLIPPTGNGKFSPKFSEIREAINAMNIEPNNLKPVRLRPEVMPKPSEYWSPVFQERRERLADILNISLNGGVRTMDDFEAIFANLPTEAGAVLSLTHEAAAKIKWSRPARIDQLELNDIEGLEASANDEIRFLSSLPKR